MSKDGSSRGTDSGKASIGKIRRGRQPRPTTLNTELQNAVRTFASLVGAPKLIQPGGFRDFSGWLDSLTDKKVEAAWFSLVSSFIKEVSDLEVKQRREVKMDIVKGIINIVVKQQPGESSKLVSTNARRQCARPTSGNTVMTIFDSYLASYGFDTDIAPTDAGGMTTQAGPSQSSAATQGELRGAFQTSRPFDVASSRAGASGIGISSLLIDDSSSRGSDRRRKLPSISQLDEQLRARSEKERKRHR